MSSKSNIVNHKSKPLPTPAKALLLFGTLGVLAFAAFSLDVFGTATLNLTLTSNPDLERGLVGHWTFDGPDMDNGVEDRSGNGNTGTLEGFTSTTTTDGILGQALEFDGSDDGVEAPDSASLENNGNTMAVSVWVKFDDVSADLRPIVSRWDDLGDDKRIWAIGQDNESTGSIRFDTSPDGDFHAGNEANTTEDGSFSVTNGVWYHIIGVADATTNRIYINGNEEASQVRSDNGFATSFNQPLQIGVSEFGGTSLEHFDGQIDDVRIYNRALSASEIKRLYDLGR